MHLHALFLADAIRPVSSLRLHSQATAATTGQPVVITNAFKCSQPLLALQVCLYCVAMPVLLAL